jgi:hypothetical protein
MSSGEAHRREGKHGERRREGASPPPRAGWTKSQTAAGAEAQGKGDWECWRSRTSSPRPPSIDLLFRRADSSSDWPSCGMLLFSILSSSCLIWSALVDLFLPHGDSSFGADHRVSLPFLRADDGLVSIVFICLAFSVATSAFLLLESWRCQRRVAAWEGPYT